jgi:hypothetical protein
MTKVHRALLSRIDEVRAVNLNTPYGFQENVDQMSQKLVEYFETSLQVSMRTLEFRSFADTSDERHTAFKQQVATATYVFAGPGSPSYALNQWSPLHLDQDLAAVVAHGGTVCFSSAAALTLGAFTPPVYEIYKAGTGLSWMPGLNLLEVVGLRCVVIPHYNNAEGGNYDTSRCYIGERRLRILEESLDPDIAVFGIDEHTAAVLDIEQRTLTVLGKGECHWRQNGRIRTFANGSVTAFDDLGAGGDVLERISSPVVAPPVAIDEAELAQRDARDERLVLTLEQVRSEARAAGNYAMADRLRDALTDFGVSVRDSKA